MSSITSLFQTPEEPQPASTITGRLSHLEPSSAPLLELRTEAGPVYVCPSRWQRVRLHWIFRHFSRPSFPGSEPPRSATDREAIPLGRRNSISAGATRRGAGSGRKGALDAARLRPSRRHAENAAGSNANHSGKVRDSHLAGSTAPPCSEANREKGGLLPAMGSFGHPGHRRLYRNPGLRLWDSLAFKNKTRGESYIALDPNQTRCAHHENCRYSCSCHQFPSRAGKHLIAEYRKIKARDGAPAAQTPSSRIDQTRGRPNGQDRYGHPTCGYCYSY